MDLNQRSRNPEIKKRGVISAGSTKGNDMNSKLKTALVAFLLVTGCVSTPVPNPVAMRQPTDSQLTCQQIAIEYKSNTEIAADKIRRNNAGDTHDIIVGLWNSMKRESCCESLLILRLQN